MPRAKKARKPVESPRLRKTFDKAELSGTTVETYSRPNGLYAWEYDAVVAARDAQVRGNFRLPVALARSLLTGPGVYAALLNRMAPHRGLPRAIGSAEPLRGTAAAVLHEADMMFCSDASSALPPGVHADAIEGLAIHALHVEQVYWEPRSDGSRLDPFVTPFPLECVEWQEVDRKLYAWTTCGRVPIVHGDGRWIVTQKHFDRPWRWGGLVPLSGVWVDRALATRDRSKNAESHGEDKWIGHLPQGVTMNSPEAKALLQELKKLYEFRRVMVAPHGSEIERAEAMGQNWQIFREIILADDKDAARILLGQDGTMMTSGGDYLKSWGMFGVRNDIIEGDIAARGAAISTGLLRPWSLLNFGRWDRLEYAWLMPDADEDARREAIAKRIDAFNRAVDSYRKNGFDVTQDLVDELAATQGVPAPRLRIAAPNEPVRVADPGAPANDVAAEQEAAAALEASYRAAVPARVVANRDPLRPAV